MPSDGADEIGARERVTWRDPGLIIAAQQTRITELEAQLTRVRALADEWESDRHRVLDNEQDPRRLGWRTAVIDHAERLRALCDDHQATP